MKTWPTLCLSEEESESTLQKIRKNIAQGDGGCIEWQASCRLDGYGQVFISGKNHAAHRAAYASMVGPIPGDMCLLHSCDNRKCVNVFHLSLGSRRDNTRDMVAKGRASGAKGVKHFKAKLTEAQVYDIRARSSEDKHELAREYGIDESGIRSIWSRKTWSHLP